MQSYARSELQASSSRPRTSHKLQALNQNLLVQVLKRLKQQAPSTAIPYKLQASGIKASSYKLHDHGPLKKFQGPLTEVLDKDERMFGMLCVE